MKMHTQINPASAKSSLRRFGVILNAAGLILILASLFLMLFLTLPGFLGLHLYAVTSGSMEPAVPIGSLVCAQSLDPAILVKDDIIIFHPHAASSTVVTHRIVENRAEQNQLITKGDANHSEDREPVAYPHVIGKVIGVFPKLGRVALLVSAVSGKVVMLALLVLAAVLMSLGDHLKKRQRV